MGGGYSLYGRFKDTERYMMIRELDHNYMDMFKHHVVSYAMDKKHVDMKSLYLYKGYFRMGKALVRGNYLELTFSATAFAEEWDSSEERLCDVAWLFRDFARRWKPVHVEYSYMRVYQMV